MFILDFIVLIAQFFYLGTGVALYLQGHTHLAAGLLVPYVALLSWAIISAIMQVRSRKRNPISKII
ncbi:hypothetical protein [Pandoraea communis]|uniref:hypothetical protein n=1 Tax=Pandoraea communis TaxID=2508297 RepID=UPI0025A527C5|nr:hypothetical protein [Pandoraea communis]MDM8356169.1 hypothetical protein [Pandoraea communis]